MDLKIIWRVQLWQTLVEKFVTRCCRMAYLSVAGDTRLYYLLASLTPACQAKMSIMFFIVTSKHLLN